MKDDTPLPRPLTLELERASKRPDEAIRWMRALLDATDAGDDDAAYRAALKAKQAAPRSITVRRMLGTVAFALQKWHEAAQELLAHRRLTGDRRHDPIIAECYRRLDRPGRAIEFLADLRRDEVDQGTWVRVQIAKARAFADSGKGEVATSLLESLRMQKPYGDAEREAIELLAELRG